MSEETKTPTDISSLSDEDFLKEDPSQWLDTEEQQPIKEEEVVEESDDEISEEDVATYTDQEEPEEDQETEPTENASDAYTPSTEDNNEPTDPEPKEEPTTEEVNYKEIYETVFASFNANGSEFKARSPEEVIRLMQMGVGYNAKMASLKPSLKVMRLLQDNDMLDIDKVNYLIDLGSKNQGAITKLVKDAGIDPLDLDLDSADGYEPSKREITDTDIEVGNVLDTLKDSPTYSKTIDVIGSMDQESKALFSNSPSDMLELDKQIASGVYDVVNSEVQRRKMLGTLPSNIPAIEAYGKIGDEMFKSGHLEQVLGTQQPTTGKKPMTPDPKQQKKEKVAEKKNRVMAGASIPNKGNAKAFNKSFDPLSLSDEEFEKFDKNIGLEKFLKNRK